MIIILWKNKNFPVNIFFSNIVLTILRILVIIFHNENWWTKNAFYYSICLNFVDGKIKISIQCMKCGISTGLTVGHANNFLSYVQNYDDNGDTYTFKEWAIYPYDDKSGPFSKQGDSGSAIVDCFGHLEGLLIGGDGITESSNITYATPISFILDSLKDNGYKVTVEVSD